MSFETDHWSSPNGCHEDCPACQAEREDEAGLAPTSDPIKAASEKAYRDAAHENHTRDGDLEFDADAIVSLSDDGGAYVQGWKWIPAAEANRCSEPGCHAGLDDGEGFDGKCGNCADKTP